MWSWGTESRQAISYQPINTYYYNNKYGYYNNYYDCRAPVRSKASCLVIVETDAFLTSVALSVHSNDSSFHDISQHFQLSFIWTISSCPTCLWVYVFVRDWKIFRENCGRLILPYGLRISWPKECQSIAPTIFPLDLCEKNWVKA